VSGYQRRGSLSLEGQSMTSCRAFRWLAPALVAPVVAFASGTDIPDQGAVAAGRGGAFTADASDASALYYNPAGFTQQRGFNFDLDLSLFNRSVSFQRTDANGMTLGPKEQTVSNSAGFFPVPMLAVEYGLPVAGRTLAIALGAVGPSAIGQYSYPAPDYTTAMGSAGPYYVNDPRYDAPQRYTLVNSNLLVFYPTLSLAYEILPKSPDRPVWLSVAASLQYIYSSLHIEQSVFGGQALFFSNSPPGCNPSPPSPPPPGTVLCGPQSMRDEDPRYDILATMNVKGGPQFTGNFGALVGIGDSIQIGAYVQLGYHLADTGTLNLDLSNLNQSLGFNAKQNGNAVTLSLNQPTIARLGVLYRPLPRLTVELDGVYEGWSTLNQITVCPGTVSGGTCVSKDSVALTPTLNQQVQPIVQNMDFVDAFSVRLGGEYVIELVVPLKLRLGFIYETSAVPEQQTRVDFPDLGGEFVTAGLGSRFGPIDVNLAFNYGFSSQRSVTDSTLLMPTSDPNLKPSVVGNGTLTSSSVQIALSVAGHFGG
jgi:long-subunit fatty acid transport protein